MAAVRYMVDTNMASYIVRGASRSLVARLTTTSDTDLCVSAVTQGELLFGLARRPHAVGLHTAIREFLARVEVLAWGSAAATQYGVLRALLEAKGMPLGNIDTLIAAHAIAADAILVTHDHAFSRVPGLAVEDWL